MYVDGSRHGEIEVVVVTRVLRMLVKDGRPGWRNLFQFHQILKPEITWTPNASVAVVCCRGDMRMMFRGSATFFECVEKRAS
jgi:hypothetical protein